MSPTTNLISDYVPAFGPLPNIAPFTYKDGQTYLSDLDALRQYVNTTIVDFVNTNFTQLGTDFVTAINEVIGEVNTALDAQSEAVTNQITAITNEATFDPIVAATINDLSSATRAKLNSLYQTIDNAIGDPEIAAIIDDSSSATRAALNSIYAGITDVLTDAGVNAIILDTGTDTRQTLNNLYGVSTGGFSDAALESVLATPTSQSTQLLNGLYEAHGTFSDAAIEAIVANSSSSTRGELNSLFAPASQAFNDAAMEGIIATGGSASRVELDSLYAPKTQALTDGALNTIVSNPASATRTELNSLYETKGAFSDATMEVLIANPASASRAELDSLYAAVPSNDTFKELNNYGTNDIHNQGLKAKMLLDTATEKLVDWSTLTGLGSNHVIVSGNTLKSSGGASPNSAMASFSPAVGQVATASCVLNITDNTQTTMFGVAGGAANSAPLASSSNAFMIGVRASDNFVGIVIGTDIGGSGQADIGSSAVGTGRFLATVEIDNINCSLTLRRESDGAEWVYRLPITRFSPVNGINNLIAYNGSATSTIEPISSMIGSNTLRTKVVAGKTIIGPQGRSMYFADPATAGTDRWRITVPPTYDPAAPKPMVLWLHNSGGDALNGSTDSRIIPLLNALQSQGFIVASADAGGSMWGNDMSRGLYRELYKYVKDNFSISGVFLVGPSMGGATALNLMVRNEIPNVLAYLGISPVSSLADLYANGYSAQINAAFNVSAIANVPARFKPESFAGSAFHGIPTMLVASNGDTTVTESTVQAIITKMTGLTSEAVLQPTTGNHMDAQAFLDAVTYGIPFLNRHLPTATTL